ncbi:MAG TPA: AAA family ATPase [Actinomycetota bacterium]|nr:AAA family ATPase [Actinomycetota bacterium]
MTVVTNRSPLDARRGVVRVHPGVLELLGLRPWDALALRGTRATAALAAPAPPDVGRSMIALDELTCANAGVVPGESVSVGVADVRPARRVTLASERALDALDPAAVRFALLGKVVTTGDRVSLLPQDFVRPGADDGRGLEELVDVLARALGRDWQQVVLEVAAADAGGPGTGPARVTMESVVAWAGGAATHTSATPLRPAARDELPGLEAPMRRLRELVELGFHRAELLARLGTAPQMGVLVSGPPGSGKAALTEAVAAEVGARVVRTWAPALARLAPDAAAAALRALLADAEGGAPAVVLLEDVEALAAADEPGALRSVLVEEVRAVVARGRVAVVCTSAHPERVARELLLPGALDVEIEVPLPHAEQRRRILEVRTASLPLAPDVRLADVAARTPGFVAADLLALCHEACLRAAQRTPADATGVPQVVGADFDAALEVVKASALDGVAVEVADVRFDDVGDMDATKAELTEAVVWPLRYPDSFERMGVEPVGGVLLYGPPGCGKTFVVKALANEAGATFLSVKGAELLSKWVGESERAVRELFRRARAAAPALVFLDEVDALAPRRGEGHDSGTTDRVVAQLLTELDGIEELRGVFVVAATNRPDLVDPALLRPGRIERAVYVPPPDAAARAAILAAATRRMPLDDDVDLGALGAACEGYSAADLDALARAAALAAMRADLDAPCVTAAHFAAARATVRPSLDPAQVAALERFGQGR